MDSLNAKKKFSAEGLSAEGLKCNGAVAAALAAWAVGALAVCAPSQARAHSWYPSYCCGGLDCHELAPGDVRITASGYEILGRFHKNFDEGTPSPDGKYHACIVGGNEVVPEETLRCFFVPQPNS